MTPSLRFFIDLTAAYVAILLGADLAYLLGWLPGGTISRAVRGLAAAHPWLPSAYLAVGLASLAIGYLHFFCGKGSA